VRVLVFGGSGATGQYLVAEATRRGHEVVTFVRRESVSAASGGVRVIHGDATDRSDVDAAIATGYDIVISALGPRSLKKTHLLETAITNILESMRGRGTSRLVELSAAGTFGLPRMSKISLLQRLTFEVLRRTILRHSFDDHAAADRLIQKSGLDWTIVQPPELTNERPRGYCISVDSIHRGGAISRADVATAMVDIMEHRSFVRESPFVFRAINARQAAGREPSQ
jgi:putative NADH-flavin reductase